MSAVDDIDVAVIDTDHELNDFAVVDVVDGNNRQLAQPQKFGSVRFLGRF